MTEHHSIVVFADMRGFTKVSGDTEFHACAHKFINNFRALRDAHFGHAPVKKMTGDGFMLVIDINHQEAVEKLTEILSEAQRLEGELPSTRAWESHTPHTEFESRERRKEDPEVHVAGTCVRKTASGMEILIARRAPARRLYPGRWEGCGGQLRRSESFEEGVSRHFLTEMRLSVKPIENCYRLYRIQEANEPIIPGVRFLCEYITGEPASQNHSEYRWVSYAEFSAMADTDFPPKLKEQVIDMLQQMELAPPRLGSVLTGFTDSSSGAIE